MAINVVDTNVWVMMGNMEEKQCALACLNWSSEFSKGQDKLAVDRSWKIINEYRKNVPAGSLAERYLNEFYSKPFDRIAFVTIEFDDDGYAVLPDDDLMHDREDRKFIAVALHFEPPAPIVNATDTDWAIKKGQLTEAGVEVQELCPDYIEARLTARQ